MTAIHVAKQTTNTTRIMRPNDHTAGACPDE
jgi:hypothetical protein